LKTFLPQVEVVTADTKQSKASPTKSATATVDHEPANCDEDYSNETIDEFASSEEASQPPDDVFKEFITPRLVNLPSMFTDCPLEDLDPMRQASSAGSSNSATVGSWTQTQIDLSPEYSPALDISSITEDSVDTVEYQTLQEAEDSTNPTDHLLNTTTTYHLVNTVAIDTHHSPHNDHLEADDCTSVSTCCESPSPKRIKVTDKHKQNDHQKQTTSNSSSVEIVNEVIEYIDLTQDSNDGASDNCCDRSSRSLSPNVLPPTPGREKVDSILERKNIAF